MQDEDTTKSTFIQLFKPILSKNFFQRLKELNADKYVKKLKTTQLIRLLSLAQIEQQRGLRDHNKTCRLPARCYRSGQRCCPGGRSGKSDNFSCCLPARSGPVRRYTSIGCPAPLR